MTVKQRDAVIKHVEPIKIGQSTPVVFRIAPKNRELLAIIGIYGLSFVDQLGHLRRCGRTIQQQPDIDIAVDVAEPAVCQAA